ncbi:hypothetical protein LINPERPRIM_LOCUS30036 [Linum perenne]
MSHSWRSVGFERFVV